MKDYLTGTPEEKLEFTPRRYECRKSLLPFGKADGNLDKPFWRQAEDSETFEDIRWNRNAPASPYFETRMKMLWDDEALYIGAYLCEDRIWGTLTERDCVIFYDNDFEVFLDPDGDTHNYYEFEMNCLNTVWDLLLTKPYRDRGMKVVNGWDIAGLETAVRIDGILNQPSEANRGWSVEIKLPWKALRECAPETREPKAGEFWRIDFSRVEWRTEVWNGSYRKTVDPETGKPFPEDNWIWSPTGRIDMHMPELWGYLHFQNERADLPPFELTEREKLKWKLRRLYYREKHFFEENGCYTADYAYLCGGKAEIDAQIFTTPSGYEAIAQPSDGGKVTIFSDGLVL